MPKATTKLRKVLGAESVSPMKEIPESSARPGAWKLGLLTVPKEHKAREVPVPVDESIIQGVADGAKATDLETRFGVSAGYVRRVLIRRFGSIEGMKRAVQAQCLENAIALNEYAIERIDQIPPSQALMGAKLMIDGALAIEKHSVERPMTPDFAAFALLGETLSRVEKVVMGTDRTV